MSALDERICALDEVRWKIDPTFSVAEFKIKHLMIANVRGLFSAITGTLIQNVADPSLSMVEATIPVTTLFSGLPQRDAHLKSPDFLDEQKYPVMTFKSTLVKTTGTESSEVTGDLFIHGSTRAVTFCVDGLSEPCKDPSGHSRVGFTARTTINRKDFGINWHAVVEPGRIVVAEEVHIVLDVELIPG